MSDQLEDPREVAWHPRYLKPLVGHGVSYDRIIGAVRSGKPHHAWLLHGPFGIGKATLAYQLSADLLGQTAGAEQARRWIETRAHPDLFVLERGFNDSKPRKLRSEISINDTRKFIDQFSRTASGDGWRIGIVDCMDDLNEESANGLLKLIEEPPTRTLMFLVCNQKGRVLRTLQSRCSVLPVKPLSVAQTNDVLQRLPLDKVPAESELQLAADLSHGSPGRALALMGSAGAAAFEAFRKATLQNIRVKQQIIAPLAASKTVNEDYRVFMDLVLEWLGTAAKGNQHAASNRSLAVTFAQLQEKQALTEAYNLDRRTAILDHLYVLEDALKAA
jgi:DNA polymerase III subunit delta'